MPCASCRWLLPVIEIDKIAPLSGVQDAGRWPWRAQGVPGSGPLDDWSMAVSNVLVGNAPDTAALEIGFGYSRLRFRKPAVIALCGARCKARIDEAVAPLWRPLWIAAGSELSLSPGRLGHRCYLAVAGGLATPEVLGSRSAVSAGGQFPGMLERGARLPLASSQPEPWAVLTQRLSGAHAQAAPWWADGEPILDMEGQATLRIIEGAHAHLLHQRRALYTQPFRLSPASNRMAARLDGPALEIGHAGSLVSEPVVPGTIQLPPDGGPLVLLAEAQTIGGYPRIGHLAGVDLARLAQRRPGSELRFEPISVALAQRLWIWRRERLVRMQIAVRARLGEVNLPGAGAAG